MQPPTIREVAKRAKVGVGTVSRVLNGSTQVREETRQRVLQAIEELGFSPNRAAQQLSGGKTFTIGVVSPFFTFPSFVERLAGIQNTLDGSAYDLTLYSIRTTTQMQRRMATVGQKRGWPDVLSLPFDGRASIAEPGADRGGQRSCHALPAHPDRQRPGRRPGDGIPSAPGTRASASSGPIDVPPVLITRAGLSCSTAEETVTNMIMPFE